MIPYCIRWGWIPDSICWGGCNRGPVRENLIEHLPDLLGRIPQCIPVRPALHDILHVTDLYMWSRCLWSQHYMIHYILPVHVIHYILPFITCTCEAAACEASITSTCEGSTGSVKTCRIHMTRVGEAFIHICVCGDQYNYSSYNNNDICYRINPLTTKFESLWITPCDVVYSPQKYYLAILSYVNRRLNVTDMGWNMIWLPYLDIWYSCPTFTWEGILYSCPTLTGDGIWYSCCPTLTSESISLPSWITKTGVTSYCIWAVPSDRGTSVYFGQTLIIIYITNIKQWSVLVNICYEISSKQRN